MNQKMEVRLRQFQDKFIFTKARFPALIAGIGTGKTMCLIIKAMKEMETYPNNLGVLVRKEFTDLRDSTMKDFELYTGLTVGSNKDVRLSNGSVLMFRHGAEINVLKNLNLGFAGIEQAEEFDTDNEHTFLRDRMRRKDSGRCLAIIGNTNGHNWIHKRWKVNAEHDVEFDLTEATTYDNADNLPPDYIADLEKMKTTHPEHFRRYVMNSWDDVDTVDQILRQDWITVAIGKAVRHDTKSIVVCDPARYGDDEHVIYALQGNKVIDSDIYTNKSTMETAGRMLLMAKRYGIRSLAVDVIGLGAGIADRLKELGHKVIEINSACASSDPEKYKNLRAELWAKAAEKFENNIVSIPKDDMLTEELSQMRYKTIESSGKLQVEAKEDYKKRLGRSPNRADAIVMGLWAVDSAQNVSISLGSQAESYKPRYSY